MPHDASLALGSPLDAATRTLVRAAAAIAGHDDATIRAALASAAKSTPTPWVEELLLQTYLFAGFPRALNATREWRRLVPLAAAAAADAGHDGHYTHSSTWEVRGEGTCAAVYGGSYDRLRSNIAALHPALDHWMIVEGYGKVLSRPALDLGRRELCIVAACAATGQARQLHSHLRGARNVGVGDTVITESLAAIEDLVPDADRRGVALLWERVRAADSSGGPTE